MRPSDAVGLSGAGVARREAILREMRGAMRGRQRRRVAVRTAVVVLPVMVVGVMAARGMLGPHGSQMALKQGLVPETPRVAGAEAVVPSVVVETSRSVMRFASYSEVETRSDLVARWAAKGTTERIVPLDDDELLSELRAMGRPTGMIRMAGHVELTTRVARGPGEADGGG